MSKVVDDRVVEMRFDNRQFESNVKTSMSTLERLKKALNFSGAIKGLDEVNAAAKNNQLPVLGSAVESVQAKFSALQVMGITALANITNSAVNAGKRIVSALTIDPIKTGFQEYETQINSVQTILANTESKGTTLNQVNAALDELNKYADQTIYNFTEMTRNIGTFTAAGVDLQTSVSAIKGIANLAAVSGSTSQQASTAMYQLSQALATGKVSLMDWNSVVNAGMGGEVFQNALKRTATQMGTNVDALIEKYGSFRESLTEGNWLTSEVLTETLTQLSGAYTEADLIAQGYSEKQAKEITQLAKTAVSAATEVKTFTQLWDTMQEAVQSGWTQTWEILVGDFGEAKELLTGISNTFGEMINASAEARNKVLGEGLSSGWKQLMGEGVMDEGFFTDILTQTAKKNGVAIEGMIDKYGSFEKTLKQGWVTSDMLKESIGTMTDKINKMSQEELKAAGYTQEQVDELNKLNKAVKDGSIDLDEYAKKMQQMSGRENIIAGLSNAFQSLMDAIKPVKEAFSEVFPPITGQQVYDMTEKFKKFTETLKPTTEVLDKIKRASKGLFSAFELVGKVIGAVVAPALKLVAPLANIFLTAAAAIGDFFTAINNATESGDFFGSISKSLSAATGGIADFINSAIDRIGSFGDILSSVGDAIGNILGKIGDGIRSVFGWISENISIGDVFNGLNAAGMVVFAKQVVDVAKKLKEAFSGGIMGLIFGVGDGDDKGSFKDDVAEKFTDILDGIHGSLESFTSGIKVASLVGIAAAIAILSHSLRSISELDGDDIAKSLVSIGAMMLILTKGFDALMSSLNAFKSSKGIVKSSVALMAMAKALDILADAMTKMSKLSWEEIAKGLVGVGAGLVEFIAALKFLDGVKINLRTSIAMLALAEACKILGDAMTKFSGLSWDEIGRGLTGMGGALGELTATLAILSKVGGFGSILGSIGILVAVQALGTMADGLKKFGEMDWDSIGRGLAGMGGALGELTIALSALSFVGGFGAILGGAAILITVQSLDEIASALQNIGSMSWGEIGRGLTGMGGALAELSVAAGALGKLSGLSGIVGGASIAIVASTLDEIAAALQNIGSMSWEEIGRGLTGMGAALAELGAASFLTGLGGLSSLAGAGTIAIVVQALDELSAGLKAIGDMSWEDIGQGLTGMAGALAILGGASFLTGLGGLASLAGAGSLNLGVQALDELATALQKFGEMSWDEIARGLTAMAGALGETALGGLLNTFSGFGAGAIAEMAEPLGTLADSMKKWAGVTVPEGLGAQLGELAGGVGAFNFSGWGADSIAAVAAPLGILADSVVKWAGVVVPEGIGESLGSLAGGVEKFNFSGWGADSIAAVAEPLGTLADSVRNWATVTVPENMQSSLESLANGVKAFNFSGWGADDMGEVVEPLGNLAGAIAKWNGITIPEGMGEKLSSLATGVKSFDTGLFGDNYEDASTVVKPIGDLAGAVSKWSGVTVSTTLGESLTSLSKGVKSFKGADPGDISGIITALGSLKGAVANLATVDFAGVTAQLNAFISSLNSLNVSVPDLSYIGTSMVTSIASGISNGTSIVKTSMTMLITTVALSAATAAKVFIDSGLAISKQTASGITKGKATVDTAVRSLVSNASSVLRGYYSSFRSSGSYVASGFAAGISSGITAAANAAARMASAASAAARRNLKIKSPSRVFREIGSYVPQGFAQGIDRFSYLAENSAVSMADDAVSSTSKVLSGLTDMLSIDADMDLNPVITPVLDLDNVKSGAGLIGTMLESTAPISVLRSVNSINRRMNLQNQNGATNNDVVNSINKLRKDLGDLDRNTYVVEGITYSDGTAVASAVQDLTRAIRMERRV